MTEEIPYGYCHCGCGQKTGRAHQTFGSKGIKKGDHYRYVAGHNRRDRGNYTVDENGCWVWNGTLNGAGYGPHRRYYERHKGPILDGLHVDHLCRNRRCVNPDHLEAVTLAENNRRSAGKLTPEQVAIVRETPRTYGSGVALARRFGVSADTIGAIRSGRSWRQAA